MKDGFSQLKTLDILSTGVLIIGLNGTVVFANASCESIFGQSVKNLMGADIGLYLKKSKFWIESYIRNKSSLFEVNEELTDLILFPESQLKVYISIHPSPDDEDHLVLEIHPAHGPLLLNHNKRMAEISENNRRLLRNLAHEIKNPLGGIRGAAQLLELELEDPEQLEYTGVVISEADRLQSLVDRILMPYRIPYKPEKINIHEILEKVRLLIEAEFPVGLKIVRDYDISVPEIDGDRGQLTQVFLNLMRNAVEAFPSFSESDATVRISTRVIHDVVVGQQRQRAALNVHIIDNGPGIPEELISTIFFPLVTGKAGGSGLGLSLVHSFVEQHGGTIEVNSRKGKTDFSLMFPLKL